MKNLLLIVLIHIFFMSDNRLFSQDSASDIVIERVYNAPVEQVWNAWTDPEKIMRWWGPKNFTSPSCQIDFREGGKYLFHMRAPKEYGGMDYYTTGVFTRIDNHKTIEFTQSFADSSGNRLDPAKVGMPAGIPAEIPTILKFESLPDNKTRLTAIERNWTPGPMRDQSQAGFAETLDKLGEMFK